jgi:predicted DsbA family dithiol-disulfide isomerase|tara:strand:- start:2949 stop:3569 length:621 start_codon:yes stop_codon:yes gene_type:complete
MKIKVFADTICGWCYIGHTRLAKVLKKFENISFDYEHVPFQLNPDMPKEGIKRLDYLKNKFGSKEAAQPMYDSMVQEALKEKLQFNLKKIEITPNTNFSHILIKLAFSKCIGHEVLIKIFEAYFSKGKNIGDKNVLVEIGKSCNINEKEIYEAFLLKKEINEINKSDIVARSMGINGVPFFEINNKTYISGAQSSTNLIEAIKVNL